MCRETHKTVLRNDKLVDVLVEQLQIYRDKEELFLRVIKLLRVGCRYRGYSSYLRSPHEKSNITRMRSILKLVSRKLALAEKYSERNSSVSSSTRRKSHAPSSSSSSRRKKGKSKGNDKVSTLRRCVVSLTKLLDTIDKADEWED